MLMCAHWNARPILHYYMVIIHVCSPNKVLVLTNILNPLVVLLTTRLFGLHRKVIPVYMMIYGESKYQM